MKRLKELYPEYKGEDVEIQGIKINSKEVKPGDIFVCTLGVTTDRHDFIDEAIKNGASAVVVSRDIQLQIPTIKVENTNRELPLLASRFYDHPEKELKLLAVTGTNGKTTVTSITQDLLGKDICGYLGTNGIICSHFNEPIINTTPDSDRLYGYFRRFIDSGCAYLSIETSSESYFRHRLDNLEFEVGVITNITEDHLNIHKTIENYVSCKQQLLRQVRVGGTCILNTEDRYFSSCRDLVPADRHLLTYGKSPEATLRIIDYQLGDSSTKITLSYSGKTYTTDSPLLGEFNIYNLCASLLTLVALEYSFPTILKRVSAIQPPKGRVQFLHFGQPYTIVLDYAHTPDAFTQLYPLLHAIQKGKLITVTGSAGGREKEKRPLMGKIVLENSDHVIFTMDDPRNENVEEIIDQLISLRPDRSYEKIIDREQAIRHALEIAEPQDIVLIAGKGIDNYMAINNEYLPYSDLEVIQNFFNKQ